MINLRKKKKNKTMKNYLLIIPILLFSINAYSAVDTSECDKIKGFFKQGEKIDCIIALKFKNSKKIEGFKKVDDKINSIEERKKAFDKKNKTLADVWKNYKN